MTGAEGDGTIEDLVYEQTTQTMLSQEKNHVSGIDANPKRLVCGLYIYIYCKTIPLYVYCSTIQALNCSQSCHSKTSTCGTLH